MSISHAFGNSAGDVVITIRAYGTPAGLTLISSQSITVSKSPPSPYTPNNGLVIGCSANESVSISSSPYLQNNAADCYFHCAYEWSASSGWNLNNGTNHNW